MEFYALFDDTFPCGIPPQHIVDDINEWVFGEHQGYGEGQVEIGVCGQIYVPIPLWLDVIIDIVGCPSASQKQIIEEQVRALFQRICPSMPLRIKQIDLIVASVMGADINSSARFSIIGWEDTPPFYPRDLTWVTACGDLEPECDVLPCLNTVNFTNPSAKKPPC
jgi:hypothetical protein